MKVTVRSRTDREHLQLAYTDPITGQIKTKSAGTSDWKKAEREAAKWESEISRGDGKSTGWESFRDRFEGEYITTLRKSTRVEYISTLNKFESLIGSPRSMQSVNASVCSEFQSLLRSLKLSEATIAKHLRQLSVALNWAQSVGIILISPKIRKPKTAKRGMRGRPISIIEFCRFMKSVQKIVNPDQAKHFTNLLKSMWLTGLRLGEAIQLRNDRGPVLLDLNSASPRIIFESQGQKSGADEAVPLTPDAIRFFRKISHEKGFVFDLNGEHGRFILSTISRIICEGGKASGVLAGDRKFVSAHDLRRTFGNRWALRVHPIVLKTLMRHSDLKTTLKYYVDLDCDSIAAQLLVHGKVHGLKNSSIEAE